MKEAKSAASAPKRRQLASGRGETRSDMSRSQTMQALYRAGMVRAKLEVGSTFGPAERDADAVADRVMRSADGSCCAGCAAGESCGGEIRRSPLGIAGPSRPLPDRTEVQVRRATGGGEGLSPQLRAFFEPRLGRDLSGVRIHRGPEAAEAARAIGARAFALGPHIGFGAGQWQPESVSGRKLIAHELAHVAQADTDESVRRQPSDAQKPDAKSWQAICAGAGGAENPKALADICSILGNFWVGPLDEAALEREWDDFGPQLPAMAERYFPVWQECLARGAELYDIPAAQAFRAAFEADVKAVARAHMRANRDYITAELERFGLIEGRTPDPEAKRRALEDITTAARLVLRAREAQQKLASIQVGYDYEGVDLPGGAHKTVMEPAYFTPLRPPMRGPLENEDPPMAKWTDVKPHADVLADIILGLQTAYPTLGALDRNSSSYEEQLKQLGSNDPQQALAVVSRTLREVLGNLDRTEPKLESGLLDWRDLTPIHDQLFSNTAGQPVIHPWHQPFYQGIGRDILSDHEAKEFWIGLGLGSLAAAAFIVAEIATLGTATFFIAAGVAAAATGIQAGRSWAHYTNLAEAARASITPERALVTSGQASAALLTAVMDTAFAVFDVYGPAARALRGASTTVERSAELAAKRALAEAKQREAAELTAREVAEQKAVRETAEGAVQAVGRQAGGMTARSLARQVADFIQDFIRAVKRWAQDVYKTFGFRQYVVEIEGEWIALYGIRSKVLLARFKRDAVETWVIEKTSDIQAALHSRGSQLGAARAANLSGDEALSNLLRSNAVHLSEEIGELAAEQVVVSRFKSAVRIHRGSGSGTLDLIFRLSSGEIIVVEAKGGAGRLITREIAPGVRAEQGTVAYLRSVLQEMAARQGEQAVANEVLAALGSQRLRYFLSETPISGGLSELITTLSEFRVR